MHKQREDWGDYIKVVACILVLLGHFFMSMVNPGIIQESVLRKWFISTVYYFHVPLFFICSGYLYQKYSCVMSVKAWKDNIIKKLVTLGIPYFTFSLITWILKAVFSGSVNNQNDDLFITLFLKPSAPYWYLYTLFFVFLMMPTFSNKKQALIGFTCVFILHCAKLEKTMNIHIYAITNTFKYAIWFVAGMCICVWNIPDLCRSQKWLRAGIGCGVLFLVLSVVFLDCSENVKLGMGILGCMATIWIIWNLALNRWIKRFFDIIVKYTMPIYLMHTIFAAGIRTGLMKLNVTNAYIHVVLGISISFLGPIIAAEVLQWMKLDILLYPGKYIKKRKRLKDLSWEKN